MEEQSTLQPLPASRREQLEAAVERYEGAVTARAVEYLTARGIGQEAALTHRLGVVDDPDPEHRRYLGMLAIPYLDKDGLPLTIRFRCLEDHNHRDFYHGKYNSIAGEPARIYGVGAIHRAGRVLHLTEGELDAIILNQIGLPAIGAPGAKSWKRRHSIMLSGFSRVYIWADPDDAGAEFAQAVMSKVRSATTLRLKDGDVNDTYLAGGADALMAVLNGEDN